MASLDDQIDELFQLPLADFTAARNALAKGAGPAGSAIRQIEKPVLAAWAVNQIYWRHRQDYDSLLTAAGHLRAEQSRQLAGGRTDVPAAEAAHDDARRVVMDLVRNLLRLSGEAASPATMTGISETLMALPGEERAGRLTRPLKPLGFQALIGLMMAGPTRGRGAHSGTTPPTTRPSAAGPLSGAGEAGRRLAKREEAEARRAHAAREKERVARRALVESELEEVRAAELAALAAAATSKQALASAESLKARLASQLAEAANRVRDLGVELARHEQRAATAAQARAAIEERLADLGPE